MTLDQTQWVAAVSGEGWHWYVKRLSGNDTSLNETHQAGPYIPKHVIFGLFPSINDPTAENPRAEFAAIIDSHEVACTPCAIWYNNGLRGGTRNECRVTGWGGRSSPILDPEATGSLCVFAFRQMGRRDVGLCRIWLCSSLDEEDSVHDRVGPVEPGAGIFYDASGLSAHPIDALEQDSICRLLPDELPTEWLSAFPDAISIVELAVMRLPTARRQSPDKRLMRRRACEYEIFRSVEEVVALPRILEGFATVDLFVDFANSLTNRRKSRSGASLELHVRTIFEEEQLPHSHDDISEERKRPDFLFPSAKAYQDPDHPVQKLQMLGVKTTCKDRWRQVINEADRISNKYLLTLQEGVSLNQFAEMSAEGVSLVVPSGLHSAYHKSIRSQLLTLEKFISLTREKCA